MKYQFIYLFLMLPVFFSCNKNQLTVPPVNSNDNLANTQTIAATVMKNMEGVYSLSNGSIGLGTEFVCKVSKTKVSFFSNQSGLFFILSYGLNNSDGSIQFSGFWRNAANADQGTINFSVATADGALDLIKNGIATNIQLKGNFNSPAQPISIKYKRPFSQYVLTHEFSILAHGGIPVKTNPPFATNSLSGVSHAEDYGANGIEIDIQLTKDNVPICMHDPSFDNRLTQKGPLYGKFSDFNFDFLQQYVSLVDGQKIPSLAQALRTFVDSTTMKYVWMDVKGDPDIFKYMEPVVRDAYAHARAVNRDVTIFAGLPSEDVMAEYQKQPTYGASFPCMCELSLQDAIDNHCQFFAPRYTLGLLLDDVNKGHTLGIKSLTWTLSDNTTILSYLQNGKFDGFLSDNTPYVVYDYYALY
ncbi:glycerophosphodiester phosphodiesterase [Mucilaginibacter jinjuensis]|uniref:Glycerophosphodiester phosphodiesterase n=1 Tax=Mucilaginibacter jinjuensis TaxID=1176721 RepID=A0ABY7TEY0_9SPHI|nr:glycerophosphodiester phosphodiesterase [Mucilaginibacter jinjuensis]WCT14942.1 glycerophosphodiester phosphodiesterase [Mucilaginibacter jinjuensis]